jgi:hypothetical protein
MNETFKVYKRKFKNTLEPLMVMLISRKSEFSREQWYEYVEFTTKSVLKNPVEFLGDKLPDPRLVDEIIILLFDEFKKEKPF